MAAEHVEVPSESLKGEPQNEEVKEKETFARQLGYLEEKAPLDPLQYGATQMLPSPLLFPGEVVKLQQSRVVCTGWFDEATVGAIFITNLRIIFYGNYVSDPDMYDVIRDLQYHHSKKESLGDITTISLKNSHSRFRAKALRNPTFSSLVTDPGEGEGASVGAAEAKSQPNPSKIKNMFDRFTSIRRSGGIIKSRLEDWADKRKSAGEQGKRSTLKKRNTKTMHITPRTISSPLGAAPFKSSAVPVTTESDLKVAEARPLSVSAPGVELENCFTASGSECKTLPRAMPSHTVSLPAPNMSSTTTDSGFIDPPKELLSSDEQLISAERKEVRSDKNEEVKDEDEEGDDELEDEEEEESNWSSQPQLADMAGDSAENSVFLSPSTEPGEEVDFERSCEPEVVQRRQRFKPAHRRPESFVPLESDSDSDTVSDRYFASITEDEDGGLSPTSPIFFSPTRRNEERGSILVQVQAPSIDELEEEEGSDEKEEQNEVVQQHQHLVEVLLPTDTVGPLVLVNSNGTQHEEDKENDEDDEDVPIVLADEREDLLAASVDTLTATGCFSTDLTSPTSTPTFDDKADEPDIRRTPSPIPPPRKKKNRPSVTSPASSTSPVEEDPRPQSADVLPSREESLPQSVDVPNQGEVSQPQSVDVPKIRNPIPKPPRTRRNKFHSKPLEKKEESSENDRPLSNGSGPVEDRLSQPLSDPETGPDKEIGSREGTESCEREVQSPVSSEGSQTKDLKEEISDENKDSSDLGDLPSPTSSGRSSREGGDERESGSVTRRRPPPPPGGRSRANKRSRGHDSEDDPISPRDQLNRSSSLIVHHPSIDETSRRLTIHSPLVTASGFDWSGEHRDVFTTSSTWSSSRQITKQIVYGHKMSVPLSMIHSVNHLPSTTLIKSGGIKIPDGIILLCKNFSSLKLYVHPQNAYDATRLKEMFEKELLEPKPLHQSFAFQYHSAVMLSCPDLRNSTSNIFNFDAEVQRIGILSTNLWRSTNITKDKPDLCRSYPDKLVVLICTPDMDLMRGASLYHEGRFPTACWMNQSNGAVLLRAATTTTERGQQGASTSSMNVDNAILQAIRSCNVNSKLHVFTERSEATSFPIVQDPKHSQLTADQAISYYYHNIHFRYTLRAPTFKSVRHSYLKMQGFLENTTIADEDYLESLESTKWLSRCGELLKTTNEVCSAICSEGAHVIVAYENGWDRTTQIVSLAQLLMDPYYRTMDGFQVLVQKEWLWFGHPFQSRNFRNSASKVKEDSPIFLQWIDCVWQVMRQFPSAFQFSEKLLMAMVEHSYSTMFGTFLGNTERERQQCFMIPGREYQSISSNTISFWTWVSMVTAENDVFFNNLYDSSVHTGLLRPLHYQMCLAVWRTHYDKEALRQEIQEGFAAPSTKLQHELKYLHNLCKDLQQQVNSTEVFIPRPELSTPSFSSKAKLTNVTAHPRGSAAGIEQTPPPPAPSPQTPQFESIVQYLGLKGHDTSICKHIDFQPKRCEGFLVKEGAMMKSWKKRWFVLDYEHQYFAYFETIEHYQSRNTPKGVIPLNQITKVFQSSKRDHLVNNIFQVRTPGRTFYIKAPSILSMEIWMDCLRLSPSSLIPALVPPR